MQPADANFFGVIHGGVILKLIDEAGGTCAYRFARRRVVTAAIDRMSFHYPVQIGNLVVCRATVNWAGRTSIEVGVRVEAEDLDTGARLHTNSAYLVFVAVDDQRRPAPVPRLLVETDAERQRWAAAEERRRVRLDERARESEA
jgi:acyl-CoA hydrolase